MAKQTKSAATPPAPDKAAAKEQKERVAQNDRFIYAGNVVEGAKKLAPQAQNIVNLVQAAGKKGITRSDLVTAMDGVVTTKQPLGRILSYYQKEVVEKGHVTIAQAAAPAKAAKPAPAAEESDESDE